MKRRTRAAAGAVRPRARRPLGRRRRRGRPRLPRRPARRRGGAARPRALGLREVRALSALNDSKQHNAEAREELFPIVMRTAARSPSSRAACAGSTAAACTARTSRRCATRCVGVARPGLRLPDRRLLGAATSATSSARSSTATRPARRSPPPRSSRRSRATASCTAPTSSPRLAVRGARRLLHARAPRRDPASGVSPLHRLSFQSTAYQQLALVERRAGHQNGRLEVVERTRRPRASITTPIASKRSTARAAGPPVGR